MAVQRVIKDMLEAKTFISSANLVVEEVEKTKSIKVKPWYTITQLKA